MSPHCSSGLKRRAWNSGEIFTRGLVGGGAGKRSGLESRSVVTFDASGAAERLGRGFWQLLFNVFSYLFIFFYSEKVNCKVGRHPSAVPSQMERCLGLGEIPLTLHQPQLLPGSRLMFILAK